MWERVARYVDEVRGEFNKITWPSRIETLGLTAMVILMIIILSIVIWFYDLVFARVIETLFEMAG